MARPKTHPDELVQRGFRLALESDRPMAHIAADLGMHPVTLRRRCARPRPTAARGRIVVEFRARGQLHGQVGECAQQLVEVWRIVHERGIRHSSHRGQYTVLNSGNPDVQAAAVAELDVQRPRWIPGRPAWRRRSTPRARA